MSETENEKSRRNFIKATGALAIGAMMGESGSPSVHEINAMSPTFQQLKAFSQLLG